MLAALMSLLISHRSAVCPFCSISLATYPSWIVGIRSMPCLAKLLWSTLSRLCAFSSVLLQWSAQRSRHSSTFSDLFQSLASTVSLCHIFRPLAPIFCSPVLGSICGIFCPFSSCTCPMTITFSNGALLNNSVLSAIRE